MKKNKGGKKSLKKTSAPAPKTNGQALPVILVLAGLLSILATALLTLLRFESKFLVQQTCVTQKQELANLALEHTLYKIQQGSNWTDIPPTLYGYTHEFTAVDPNGNSIGTYTIHTVNGNLFLTDITHPEDYTKREARNENKTIGIKVKTKTTGCVGEYYAVVQRASMGGPLVSKGKINLPCTDAKINDSNFYWGDIFSGNPASGKCYIPQVNVAKAPTSGRTQWLPQVYSKNDIWTAVGYTSGGRSGAYQFGFTYDDMSPTAHSHPYSEFANVPDMDLEALKSLAHDQGSYYGPATIPGTGSNKYFINDGKHDNYTGGSVVNDVIQANAVTIMAKLLTPASVLFIDTTDGLPVRYTYPSNTYSGLVTAPANYTNDKTIRFYISETNQLMTAGTCVVQGPLELIGYDPASRTAVNYQGYNWGYGSFTGLNADDIANVPYADNYYWPQQTDSLHYVRDMTNDANSKLTNVKHYGTIYCGGELKIGGPHTGAVSNICIYGTIYLGEQGILNVESNATYDNALLYVYYNRNLSLFGMDGVALEVLSFGELTFLIPTPVPAYPASF